MENLSFPLERLKVVVALNSVRPIYGFKRVKSPVFSRGERDGLGLHICKIA